MRDRELLLESCEDRILCDGTPDVTLQAPANVKIGEQVQVTATFDNTAANAPGNTGFGPYIDLVLKATGTDGGGAEMNDGITFVGATYLGSPVSATVLNFDANGQATHPFAKDANGAPLVVNAPAGYGAGDQLVVLRLPFGSFAPDQPPAPVTLTLQTSNLADVNAPLPISARGGFIYPNDGTDSPDNGATVVDPTYSTATVTPTLFTLNKVYVGPENETATGPNYQRQYRIELDVATGQTLTNVRLTDLLPGNLQFVSVISLTGGTENAALAVTPSTTVPGGTLTRALTSITGQDGVDAVLTFSVYVPRIDVTGNAIINPASGDDVTVQNNASASGSWTPIDPRDPPTTATIDAPGPEHVLTAKSIATQKTVTVVNDTGSPGATPGDTLEYTIQVQVSDYFAFQNLVLSDLFSDGQRLDASFAPTMSWLEHGVNNPISAFATGNYTVFLNADNNPNTPATDGSTTLTFNISSEMVARGGDAKLLGGGIPDTGTGANPLPNNPPMPFGPTTVTIRFRTVIQDQFSDTYPSGDAALNPSDSLGNNVTISGDLLNVTDATTPTGQNESDTSQSSVTIKPSSVSKTVYAINGNTAVPANVLVKTGDTVTYRIRYTIPSGDVENLVLSDYLPIPIFLAGEITTFSPVVSGTPPAAGTAQYGPLETLRLVTGGTPTPGVNTASNALIFTYPPAIDDPTNTTREVDILFTVTVGDVPGADLSFVTNLVQATETGTNGPTSSSSSTGISGIQVQNPVVATGGKGIVGYNNTGLTLGGITFTAPGTPSTFTGGPIFNGGQATAIAASDLLNGEVDAGDMVRFALVIQNTGRADAYDVRFEDQIINPGYNLPSGGTSADRLNAINLRLLRGDGSVMVAGVDYNAFLTAGGLLQIELIDNYTSGNVDETGSGGLSRGLVGLAGTPVTNGSNTVIATYDLTLASTAPGIPNLGATITNTATLSNYASIEGGQDFAVPDLTDSASVKLAQPTLTKTLTGTEIVGTGNSNTQAVIGEYVTYTITLTLPEGSVATAQLLDTLDAGLAFVDVLSVTPSAGVAFTGSSNPTVTNSGRNLAFNFGTLTNSNTDNAVTDTITVVYRAVVLNANTSPNNQAGTLLNNGASFSGQFTDLPTGTPQSYATTVVAADNVTVVEPTLTITKGVGTSASGPFAATLTNVDAGDAVFYQIAINNATGPTAFDLYLNDVIPAALTNPVLVSVNGGATLADFALSGQTLSAIGDIDVPAGTTITIVVQGTLASAVQPNQSLTNNATIRWSSLNGDPGLRSTFNASSTERTGDNQTPAAGVNLATSNQTILNNYAATSGSAVVTIANPTPTKTIDATSEASTGVVGGIERVTIGEIVRYRIVWRIPEGSANNLTITDLLPASMQFINDGTATLAFVSSGGNISSSISAIGTGASVVGDGTTLAGINPSFIIPSSQITGGAGNGGDPVFNLGNIINPDRDADQEFVVVEFNASVLNVTGNQGLDNVSGSAVTTNLTNSVQVQTATSNQTSPGVTVQVVEPAITNVTKTVSPGPYDAGNNVTYTITFSNATGANSSTAFDVSLTDVVPAFLTNVRNLVATSGGTVTGLTGGISGNTVTVAADSIAPGGSVTITFVATVVNGVPANQVVTNTSSVVYTSLPGSGSALDDGVPATTDSLPGASGSSTGERTGAGGIGADGSVLNNYADSGSVSFTVQTPIVDKSFQNGTLTEDDTSVPTSNGANVVIGEKVFYDILVNLPEGVTPGLRINDIVPAGLRIDSIQILTTTASTSLLTSDFSGTFTTTPTLDAPFSGPGTLTFNFGDTTVPGDNDPNNTSFVIRVRATVLNTLPNQTGTTLANTATLTYNSGGSPITVNDVNTANNPVVTVVEPDVTTTKTVDNNTPDAGDTPVFTITLTNTSGQWAYDLSLEDLIPPGFLNPSVTGVTSTGTITVNGVAGTPVANVDVIISGGTTLQFANGSNIDMAPGATLVITGTGVVTGSALPNNTVINTATTRWTSTNGLNPDERTGVDGAGSGLNNYESSGSVSVTVPSASFSKVLFGTSEPSTSGNDVTIGEHVFYALAVNLPEGTIPGLVVTDLLPDGMQYVNTQIVTTVAGSGGRLAFEFGGAVPPPVITGGVGSGDDVTYTFGQIVVDGDNDPTNNVFLILVEAVVLDVPGNVGLNPPGQTVLPNRATFDVLGDGVPPFTTSAVDVNVVEPQMAIEKHFSPVTGDAGDTVTITLTVQNTGTSDAFDVMVNDPLSTRFAGILEGNTPTGFTFGLSGNTVTYSGGTIGVGESVTFTFTAVLTSAVQPGESIPNIATVTQATTLPGADPNERFEPTVNATDVIAVPVGSYSKTLVGTSDPNTPGTDVGISETVTYALKITLPEGTTNGLVVTDLIPAGMQYLSASVVSATGGSFGMLTADFNGTIPGPAVTGGVGNGGDVTFTFGTISVTGDNNANNNSFIILVTARVLDVAGNIGITGNQTILNNQASFDIPTDGQPTFVTPEVPVRVVEPRLQIVKAVDDNTADLGQTLNYTLTISHTGQSTEIAYDVLLRDALPAGISIDLLSIRVNGQAPLLSPIVDENTSTGSLLDLKFSELALGDTITITYSATVGTSASLTGANLDNTAKIYWDTDAAEDVNIIRDGGTDNAPDRDLGADAANEVFDQDTDPAQDTERVTVNSNTISGTVYVDQDVSGTFQLTEPGIANVTLILSGTTAFGEAFTQTVQTDANGNYTFTGVPRGDYVITETQPAGYLDRTETAGTPFGGTTNDTIGADTISDLSVPEGSSTGTGYNFGEVQGSSLSGFAYRDLDNDGIRDVNEGPVLTTITLTGIDDLGNTVNFSQSTNPLGAYSFNNLRPGTYTITESQPSSLLDGKETVGSQLSGTINNNIDSNTIADIVLGQNVNGANNNFGDLPPSRLAGHVYIDGNNDGFFDGNNELPILGATVTLTGTDDRGNAVNVTLQTGLDGSYNFTQLRPSDAAGYTITEIQPAGFLDGQDTIGTLMGTTGNDVFSAIVVTAGQEGLENNFGELRPASLSGNVYMDADNDGIFDANETGIGGVTITLTGTDDLGPVSLTLMTDGTGAYSFTNLRPGTYTITETQPGAYFDGIDTIGTPGGTPGNDVFSAILVTEGTVGTNNNFGELTPSSLSGTVYRDLDNDGVIDGGESGIGGVTVTLTGIDDLGAPVSLTTTTDGNGGYIFGNLRPGVYTILETQPAGFLDGKDTIGTPGGTAGNDVFNGIILLGGVTGVNNNFGELPPSSLSGVVYIDSNNNGIYEPGNGETLITAPTTITLTGMDDLGNAVNIPLTTSTGAYTFSNLRPGTYTITETTPPTGYLDGQDTIGTPGGIAGNDVLNNIVLPSDTNGLNNNFGELRPASISGRVFIDQNNDGFDLGDPGLFGVRVTLIGTDDLGNPVNQSVLTNLQGDFSFGNLRPGTYSVVETQPILFLDGKDRLGTLSGGGANAQPGVLSDDRVDLITLTENTTGVDYKFGELQPASLSGTVFLDKNNDGFLDPNEPGIKNVEVQLRGIDDRGNPVSRAATTDDQGHYRFGFLRPGLYEVIETQPKNYLDGKDQIGTASGIQTDKDTISLIVLNPGVDATDYNFGERPKPPPPLPPEPPVNPDEPPAPGPFIAYDSFNNYGILPQSNFPLGFLRTGPQSESLLPLAPIYSGTANPGATLQLDLYTATGDYLGTVTTMADVGGNWLANFTNVDGTPANVCITQTSAPYSFGSGVGANTRVYYAPTAVSPGQYISRNVERNFEDGPAPLLGGLDLANPISLGTVKYGTETLPVSSVAAGR